MKTKNKKSWVDKKLEQAEFRNGLEAELKLLEIGEQLARLRIISGLTQAEVGKRVGTTASAISRYENADYDRYEVKTLDRLARACGGVLDIKIRKKIESDEVA